MFFPFVKLEFKLLFLVTLFLWVTKNGAAQPNWTLDPANFEYTMTLTGVGIIACAETMDERDIVAAFIDGDVRGVQYFDGRSQGRNYAYMVVYDSIFSGNKISFKMYDASEDKIVDVLPTLVFMENANIGNDEQPFLFESAGDSVFISTNRDSVYRYASIGDTLLQLFTFNRFRDSLRASYQFVDDSLGIDNSYFRIQDSLLVLAKVIDQLPQKELYVHLRSKTGYSCETDEQHILFISDYIQTGTAAEPFTEEYYMYPNPVSDILNFQYNGLRKGAQLEYSIMTMEGQTLVRSRISAGGQLRAIPVLELHPSIYILQVSEKGRVLFRARFLKV